MPYLTEPEPPRGALLPVRDGIWRIVADNPSLMTCHGTNTYILRDAHGTTLIDPGPEDAAHLDDVLRAVEGGLDRILLTHGHRDHFGNAAALREATGAPLHAHSAALAPEVVDVAMEDGDTIAGMTAVHTPGHAPDHLCFARPDGVLFSGDHVMGWNSTIVSPPLGDMGQYMASLRLLRDRPEQVYLPGHGPVLTDPAAYIDDLLQHRMQREAEIEAALRDAPGSPPEIADRLYAKTDPVLRRAAERNVRAHLAKLLEEGRVREAGEDLWQAIR